MESIANTILALERAALDRWGNGDPDGFLELVAPDVSYIDPVQQRPLRDGAELTELYDQLRGAIDIESSEIVNARVQEAGDVAVLSFQFFSRGSEGSMNWNATEVYQKLPEGWRIIHTHWSYVQPELA
ncbi:MAG TPA: nuclear transport factor 2 family protein [Bryobacteraceae bacterium]